MSVIVHHMTAAMLVLHLMVGCCAHHAHGCTDTCGASEPRVDAFACSSCADSHGTDDQADHQHRDGRECHGEKCSFVRPPEETSVEARLELSPTSMTVLLDDDVSPGISGWHDAFIPDRLLLSVRLHLAYRVLLI